MPAVVDLLRRKGRVVHTISPTDSVVAAATAMNQHGVGGLVVVDSEGQLVGMFTERDILRRVVAPGRDPATTVVGEVMTTEVLACQPETSLEECAAVMTSKRIRHLPVRDRQGLVGIVTIGDLLAQQVDDQRATIQYLTSFVYDNR
ncbi:MAG: CBS domain-containing protein [Gemmatimonadetes bacterium]|nr:CBS domain-containing protein [Gemmatimonadota bacterium]